VALLPPANEFDTKWSRNDATTNEDTFKPCKMKTC
jgi:hypothetical protein